MYKPPSSTHCAVLLPQPGIPQLTNLSKLFNSSTTRTIMYYWKLRATNWDYSCKTQWKSTIKRTLYNNLKPPVTERTSEEDEYENMSHDSFVFITIWKKVHQEPRRQWWCTYQFCYTGSREFWQVCNPVCTVNEYFTIVYILQSPYFPTGILLISHSSYEDRGKFQPEISRNLCRKLPEVCWTVHYLVR